MVPNALTLREIQTKHGVTGSFNDRILLDWLQTANPSPEQCAKATVNFTASCAAYCVATYVLGICDRHNDNMYENDDYDCGAASHFVPPTHLLAYDACRQHTAGMPGGNHSLRLPLPACHALRLLGLPHPLIPYRNSSPCPQYDHT